MTQMPKSALSVFEVFSLTCRRLQSAKETPSARPRATATACTRFLPLIVKTMKDKIGEGPSTLSVRDLRGDTRTKFRTMRNAPPSVTCQLDSFYFSPDSFLLHIDCQKTMEVQILSPEVIQDVQPTSTHESIPPDQIDAIFSTTATDLISAPLGTRILHHSDDFFASSANLINPLPPISRPGVFIETGAW